VLCDQGATGEVHQYLLKHCSSWTLQTYCNSQGTQEVTTPAGLFCSGTDAADYNVVVMAEQCICALPSKKTRPSSSALKTSSSQSLPLPPICSPTEASSASSWALAIRLQFHFLYFQDDMYLPYCCVCKKKAKLRKSDSDVKCCVTAKQVLNSVQAKECGRLHTLLSIVNLV